MDSSLGCSFHLFRLAYYLPENFTVKSDWLITCHWHANYKFHRVCFGVRCLGNDERERLTHLCATVPLTPVNLYSINN